MIKTEELAAADSCLNKAADDEVLFVLRAKDPTAPDTIRSWAEKRVIMGLNKIDDAKIVDALACANSMETWRANR